MICRQLFLCVWTPLFSCNVNYWNHFISKNHGLVIFQWTAAGSNSVQSLKSMLCLWRNPQTEPDQMIKVNVTGDHAWWYVMIFSPKPILTVPSWGRPQRSPFWGASCNMLGQYSSTLTGSWEAGQNWESVTDERSEWGDMTSGRSMVSRVGSRSTGSAVWQAGRPTSNLDRS